MFRLQNNVPEVYVDKSRDFQLFCRLYDSCFGGVKYSIDSLIRASNTKECDSSLLELLKTKLGLFTTIDVDDKELRYLLQAFPTIMRYKGSKQGLEYVKTLYTKMYNVTAPSFDITKDYYIRVTFNTPPKNDKLLLELLKYVLPTGYLISYAVAEMSESRTLLATSDRLEYISSNKQEIFATLGSINDDDIESDSITPSSLAIVGLTDIPDTSDAAEGE